MAPIRMPMIAVVGVLFIMLGLAQSALVQVVGDNDADVMVDVTMDEIDIMMNLEDLLKPISTAREGDDRELQEDDTCWHGGQENQNLYWLGRSWGNCQSLDPCVCGLHPRRMAYWCPELCRPSCGGACATPSTCPDGFNVENDQLVEYIGTPNPDSYPTFWPANWGEPCYWYDNPAAPGATPAPTPGENTNSGPCSALNEVCNDTPCCSGLACGQLLSDNNRYCAPASGPLGGTPPPSSPPPSPPPPPSPTPAPPTQVPVSQTPSTSDTTVTKQPTSTPPSSSPPPSPIPAPPTLASITQTPTLGDTTNGNGQPTLGATPAPTLAPNDTGIENEECAKLYQGCEDMPCCANLSCEMQASRNVAFIDQESRYCVRDSQASDSSSSSSKRSVVLPVGLSVLACLVSAIFL